MKKEAALHFIALLVFLVVYSLIHSIWLFDPLVPVAFAMGSIVGTILPDIDHLIYIYFLRPEEYVSLRTQRMLKRGEVWEALSFLAEERASRTALILHTVYFLTILAALAFLVLTSSGSSFGAGLIFAFFLHLLVDLLYDYLKQGNIRNWYQKINLNLTNTQEKIFMAASWGVFIFFALAF